MYIVFEADIIENLREKYILLEMDTFKIPNEKLITAHCVIDMEHITFQEITILDHKEKIHKSLIDSYKSQNWDYCNDAIKELKGSFKGEMDSYYDIVLNRINKFRFNTDKDWSHIIIKDNINTTNNKDL